MLKRVFFVCGGNRIRVDIKTTVTADIVNLCIRSYGIKDECIRYEVKETAVLLHRIRKASVFFDIGAGIGYYSLLAALYCKTVVAFEIQTLCAREIEFHAWKNGLENIIIDTLPVGDGSIIKFDGNGKRHGGVSVRLDEYVNRLGIVPDIVKMDIEGSEALALEGMNRILKENQDIKLIVEFFPLLLWDMGSSPKDFINKCTDHISVEEAIAAGKSKKKVKYNSGKARLMADLKKEFGNVY